MNLPTNLAEREEAVRLLEAAEAAREAYAEQALDLVRSGNSVVRCAKTGIPIEAEDEIVEDCDTGEVWLRAALGLPPRQEVEEAEVEEDTDIEEAA